MKNIEKKISIFLLLIFIISVPILLYTKNISGLYDLFTITYSLFLIICMCTTSKLKNIKWIKMIFPSYIKEVMSDKNNRTYIIYGIMIPIIIMIFIIVSEMVNLLTVRGGL